MRTFPAGFRALIAVLALASSFAARSAIFPGRDWVRRTPVMVGMDVARLDEVRTYLGGRGCIVRYGCLAYTWGNYTARGDVASAAKPWYSTLLFKAIEEGLLPGLDTAAVEFEPRLGSINAALGFKDTNITFRHFANQVSCYGVRESPGAAYDYNDWQMALFWDTLFLGVYGATYATVDAAVLHPRLTDILQCQDNPTFMAFGTSDRPGRLGVSPRDFARLGLLYLHRGNWNGTQVLSQAHATLAVSSPIPLSIPRTAGQPSEMIPGQRTIGSTLVPDNQTDHDGGYSWLWWVNGVRRNGDRKWPDAPPDVYACLGHSNGKRGMAVMPSQQIVIAWNDTTLDTRPSDPHPLNYVFKALMAGVVKTNQAPRVEAGSDLVTAVDTVVLDGTVSDDGLPGGGLLIDWAAVSGPGWVTFTNSAVADTAARFGVPGDYRLRLRADDGDRAAEDEIRVRYAPPAPMAGQIIVDPAHPNRLAYRDTYVQGRLQPCFFAGPGDPEDFFYNNTSENLALLKSRQARCTYITAYLADFGGGSPGSGAALDATLETWETYMAEMENAGIITVFFFLDDSKRLPADWETAVDKIVNRFEHHKLLIWSVAEEYGEVLTPATVSAIAQRIQAADDHDHVIGVHQNSGTRFDFNSDPRLAMFLIQYNASDADAIHRGLLDAVADTQGQKVLNLAEVASHAQQDRATARQWSWAAAMGGVSAVQVFDMGRASDDPAQNDPGKYEDCAILNRFMEQAALLNSMSPRDDLAHGATRWVMADPGTAYIAYATSPGPMGIREMTAGAYLFRWLDIPSGTIIEEASVAVPAGDCAWSRPSTIGDEAALYVVNLRDLVQFSLRIGREDGEAIVAWETGTLVASAAIQGPYEPVTVISPYVIEMSDSTRFYRVRFP